MLCWDLIILLIFSEHFHTENSTQPNKPTFDNDFVMTVNSNSGISV